ncbi:GDSL esterase/lipase [Canna indica]|uniref:GDSL esterase/lipase n=1 Tax=Canna indica TaxID=4628 RepID=A0AAQ3L142_9LILI|nr:GDSL esterase/lipase [Canna indica]
MEKAKLFVSAFPAFSLAFLMMATVYVAGTSSSEMNSCGYYSNQRKGEYDKLFIFGDSYADTGNLGKLLGRNIARSWFEPYGMSFPAKPAGRFSDGRVLTDYVASFMRIRSPIPYKIRRAGYRLSSYGMNFAVAGSGVFDTGNFQRNLAAQINEFQAQIDAGVFSKCDIKASAALVAVSGNDYLHFAEQDPNYSLHLDKFMDRLFIQLKSDLERLKGMGVPKVMVTNLHPIECTPSYTRPSNYTACALDVSAAVADHNRRIDRMVMELDGARKNTSFLSLDLNTAISNIVLHQVNGTEKFKYALVPCCESKTSTSNCGQVDDEGNKLYEVCCRPEEHVYWDSVHPTQAGWAAAFEFLEPALGNFLRL